MSANPDNRDAEILAKLDFDPPCANATCPAGQPKATAWIRIGGCTQDVNTECKRPDTYQLVCNVCCANYRRFGGNCARCMADIAADEIEVRTWLAKKEEA